MAERMIRKGSVWRRLADDAEVKVMATGHPRIRSTSEPWHMLMWEADKSPPWGVAHMVDFRETHEWVRGR
jgi:hypothetical protein